MAIKFDFIFFLHICGKEIASTHLIRLSLLVNLVLLFITLVCEKIIDTDMLIARSIRNQLIG